MVKPAMPYLDIIKGLNEQSNLPIAAYHVSGEYAMLKAAAQNGWLDEKAVVLEGQWDASHFWLVRGTVMDIVNYYADLGIEDDHADEATIKKAYRKLVLKWHPDKHPENRDEAETQIRKINNAYEVLSNPTKRSTYDDQRRAVKRKKQGFGPPPPSGAPRMRIPKEFMMMPIGPTDSEVGLEDARKGEKVDKVNFIAVTSPAYEGAFRFEAAYRKGD
eukprot:g2024.t1